MGVRASQRNAARDEPTKPRVKLSKRDKKAARPHLSKKARETRKEMKVVEKEMAEAEAEVDEEDRATQVTCIRGFRCELTLDTGVANRNS